MTMIWYGIKDYLITLCVCVCLCGGIGSINICANVCRCCCLYKTFVATLLAFTRHWVNWWIYQRELLVMASYWIWLLYNRLSVMLLPCSSDKHRVCCRSVKCELLNTPMIVYVFMHFLFTAVLLLHINIWYYNRSVISRWKIWQFEVIYLNGRISIGLGAHKVWFLDFKSLYIGNSVRESLGHS